MVIKKSHGYVFISSIGFSFILVFSTFLKDSGVSGLEQSLVRLALTALLLLVILKGKPVFPLKNDLPYFISIGFVFALFHVSGLLPIFFGTPIAVAAGLINTQPIFTSILAGITGRERISWKKISVILLGVCGALMLAGLSPNKGLIGQLNIGVILGTLGGFLYAVYLFLKRYNKTRYSPLDSLFNTLLFAVPCALIISLVILGFSDSPTIARFVQPNLYQFALLILFSIFSTVIPYTMLNKVDSDEVSPTTEGTILLLSTVLHASWAVLIFNEFVTSLQYIGMFLVLISAVLTLRFNNTGT
jgi:drug/metabolite transporter (DMT)-like permease